MPQRARLIMLQDAIQAVWPTNTWRSCHVVVAVSGGADSVALLRGLAELHRRTSGSGELIVAHFNHGLRGEHSDGDQSWVAQLAQTLNLRGEFGQPAESEQLDTEQSARDARYAFLLNTAERCGARYIATAHTADDQVETVLMRVLRGSGIDGLTGIPRVRSLSASVSVVRPLLAVRREEIESYLQQLDQPYRTDASNHESHFTRNWLRNELLPAIRERLPSDPDRSLLRLAEQANQWSELLESIVAPLVEQTVRVENHRLQFNLTLLADQPAIVVQQVARQAWRAAGWPEQGMGMADWERLSTAISGAEAGKFQLPGHVQVAREAQTLELFRGGFPENC
ncbi:tRNA lysidine(34) synthetase TilS [Aeoliella mucimassa]|uniref:tRNA(Ile)-lysidine synthase n=1 Tax=Aeoliella mucimassa TaxID=2527972 RepID=A0A518AKH5_9BACT|nr:tRNA lysidine(34) synthetase TilS [Aeoliella mucimassa]QDU55229.1 tRNA(Ile)-lysidine synthase [Aeoliella mucimassa]